MNIKKIKTAQDAQDHYNAYLEHLMELIKKQIEKIGVTEAEKRTGKVYYNSLYNVVKGHNTHKPEYLNKLLADLNGEVLKDG